MTKVLSLFSGIGAFERACCRIGLDWELVNYCEIDRWASLSYSMVNQCSESLNLRDVRAVTADSVRDRAVDLITYGFPCQDISIAGKQQGFVNDSGESTRSGLFFEALRIIKELRPRYAIAENVKALTSAKFKNEFATVLSSLEEAGYKNYWRVLNAKDYGIPQNRERVFIVSIRRDVDEGDFQFPEKEPLMLRLRDMLEPAESVDEKYYLNTEREGVRRLIAELESRYRINSSTAVCVASRGRNRADPSGCTMGSPTEQRLEPNSDGCTNTLTTVQKDNLLLVAEPGIMQVGNIAKDPNREHIQDRIYGPSGLAPTLTVGGGSREPKIVIDGLTRDTQKQKDSLTTVQKDNLLPVAEPGIMQVGNIVDNPNRDCQRGRIYDPSGLAPTLNTVGGGGLEAKIVIKDPLKIAEPEHAYGVRIRKLTPRECWRLMGFLDEEFDRVHGISNSQLYKQAGNSIVVNVLSALLSQLFYRDLI